MQSNKNIPLFLPHQQILPKFIASQPCQNFGHISPTEFFQRCLFAKLHFRPVDCVSSASICLFFLAPSCSMIRLFSICLWGNPRDRHDLTGPHKLELPLVKSLSWAFWEISVAASQMAPDEETSPFRWWPLCRLKPLLQAFVPCGHHGVYTLRHWGTHSFQEESHMWDTWAAGWLQRNWGLCSWSPGLPGFVAHPLWNRFTNPPSFTF